MARRINVGSRSKTGCRTCRIRRVKCDEARPFCTRCCSTGRRCDGYEVCVAGPIRKQVLLPKAVSSPAPSVAVAFLPRLTSTEQQGFVYFRDNTSREAAGCFVSAFWQRFVLQLAHQEPSVLHAAIGVGAMHRSTRGQSPSLRLSGQMDRQHSLAVAQYVKAIRHLRGRLEQCPGGRQCQEVALVACLLFVCLEMLQGNRLGVLMHLQNGLRVLAGIPSQVRRIGNGEHQCLLISRERATELEQLTEIFARLDLQSTSFGEPSPVLRIASTQDVFGPEILLPTPFRDIYEARHFLDRLTSTAHFIRGQLLDLSRQSCRHRQPDAALQCCVEFAGIRRLDPSGNPSLFAALDRLQTDLTHWLVTFQQLNPLAPARDSSEDPPSHMLLELQCHAVFIQVATYYNDREVFCDQLSSTFQRIVDLCGRFISKTARSKASTPHPSGPTFVLDSGLVPALYLTAVKCRQSNLRQKAISLLYHYSCQEGMWEPTLIAQFVHGISRLEEEAARSALEHGTSTGIRCENMAEASRFCDVVLAVTEQVGQGRLVCARYRHETTGELQITEHLIPIALA